MFTLTDGLDLIFKNQAVDSDKPSGQFVNDLLRTEFHRYVAELIEVAWPADLIEGNS